MKSNKISKFCFYCLSNLRYALFEAIELQNHEWRDFEELTESEYKKYIGLVYFTGGMIDEMEYSLKLNTTYDSETEYLYYVSETENGTLICKTKKTQFYKFIFLGTQGDINDKLLNTSKFHYCGNVSAKNLNYIYNDERDVFSC
jgi:hypothetical protein